ncbi:hypothetical protein F442_02242 [Phytophthora nicotianae P10297]|uniref:Uncharacterized protein n=1 Tax=Phytophthora nicotianae P10297 TaxID=1317064 RepID=W2ZZJ4_PHYNI|nr:hypothetical protein F442_02242 [Phytophthora nicotianae P10297]
MRQWHLVALNNFTGSGSRASRNSSSILRKIDAPDIDESLGDTVFDEPAAITSGRDETAQSAEDPRVLAGQLSDESDGDEDKAPPPAAVGLLQT